MDKGLFNSIIFLINVGCLCPRSYDKLDKVEKRRIINLIGQIYKNRRGCYDQNS